MTENNHTWSDEAQPEQEKENTTMDLSQSPLLQSAPEEEQTGKKIRSIQETADNRLFFAGFWMRFWAYILDLIIVGSIDRLVFKPILKAVGITHYDIAIFSPVTIASAVVFYLYFVLMTKYLGQTLGKMVFGLRVVGLKENRLSWGTVLFRELIGRFISKTTFIGYIIVGFLPKKQGLHDIFADTTVVLEKR